MRSIALGLALALVAGCKDQGPKGLDPIVLAHNAQSVFTPVVISWFDQSGQVMVDTIPANSTVCTHFTSTTVADSVRFFVTVGDPQDPTGQRTHATAASPWFDPATGGVSDGAAFPFNAEYWTMTVNQDGNIIMGIVEHPPC